MESSEEDHDTPVQRALESEREARERAWISTRNQAPVGLGLIPARYLVARRVV